MGNAADRSGKLVLPNVNLAVWSCATRDELYAERGIDFASIVAQAGQPDAARSTCCAISPSTRPCSLARQRACSLSASNGERVRVRSQSEAGRDVQLSRPGSPRDPRRPLGKYDSDSELQFTLSDALKLRPISQNGNVNQIIGKFGGRNQPRTAVNRLQSLLYAA